MMDIQYEFINQGSVVSSKNGHVYIDVGNKLEPGVLDHHQPGAPDLCATALVLKYPDWVRDQVSMQGNQEKLTIIVHNYPDLDAISGAWLASNIARGKETLPIYSTWADYVCSVDRGFTRLNPSSSLTLYSLFIMRLERIRKQCSSRVEQNNVVLEQGFQFLTTVFANLLAGKDISNTEWLNDIQEFAPERQMIEEDILLYQADIENAEQVIVELPNKGTDGKSRVLGLWIAAPKSILFKSWARGDSRNSKTEHGFIFTGVQLSRERYILSVTPDSNVYLKGLGDLLEISETKKRIRLGKERQGKNRPGYNSPDPWYDGRSPLHNYTIVDAPRAGTTLSPAEIRGVFKRYVQQ